MLWFNMCVALFRGGEAAGRRRALDLCKQHLGDYFSEPSLSRARVFWFMAKIHEADENRDLAIESLEDALLDVELIQHVPGVAAIVADLERLRPGANFSSLRSRIEDLEELDAEGHTRLPAWLRPISDLIQRVLRVASFDFDAALRILRTESGGAGFMPELT